MKQKDQKPGRIKSAIIRYLGLTDYQQWQTVYQRDTQSGVTVNTDKALTLSSVWACTRLVSQTIATLPLAMYRKAPDGSRVTAEEHPVHSMIARKPNADMTAVVFWECIIGQAVLHGNGFAEKVRINGRVVSLNLLPSELITWQLLPDGDWQFWFTEYGKEPRAIASEDIFHVPGFSLNGKFGLSIIHYGAEVFGSALAGNGASYSTFKNGLMPATYYKFDHFLKPEQREDFREKLKDISGAMNAGKSPLLEGGMDIGTTGINPVDAQLLESRVYSLEEVCRWFGVPPSMIGSTDKASSWASSSEQLNMWFLQYGLRPWLKKIESAIWDCLIPTTEQRDHFAEFNVEGLLRTNTEARTNHYSQALQNGWMSRNDVRRKENLPPIDGGDIYTAQTNLAPLDKLGDSDAD